MYQFIIVIHVLFGLGVVGLVLLQQGKGADAGAAFGSASSGSVFGAQGASSFLSTATAVLATLFFCTSLGLAIMNGRQGVDLDLMDTPNVEEIIQDVPTIDGLDNISDLENSVPVETETFPVQENMENIIPEVVDSVSEEFNSVINMDSTKETQ